MDRWVCTGAHLAGLDPLGLQAKREPAEEKRPEALGRWGGGVVPAECMVPNNIARSYASDLDFFITSKPCYSTSCGIDLPMFEEWHPIEELRKLRTGEPHAERKKTFGSESRACRIAPQGFPETAVRPRTGEAGLWAGSL